MKKLLLALLILAAPAFAQQDPVLALRAASAEIDAARAALAQAEAGQDQQQALARSIRSLEGGLASLRLALRASMRVEAEKRAEILQNREELGSLLAMLGALENTPAALKILHPDGAVASVRAGIVLAAITPELQARAAQLRGELIALNALSDLHANALSNLQTALQTLQNARNELTITMRENLPPPSPAPAGMEQLARASRDLSGLAAGLSAGLPGAAPLAVPVLNGLKGRLPLPVDGVLARSFNLPNAAGIRQPGIVLTAPPLSLVLAPQAGIVRFSGDFLEYGQVVILEPAPEQLQIYAGFGQVYVSTGEVLESGAPMGLLGGKMPDSAEFLAENDGENDNGGESLYIEIRENGIPVDPLMWFALN